MDVMVAATTKFRAAEQRDVPAVWLASKIDSPAPTTSAGQRGVIALGPAPWWPARTVWKLDERISGGLGYAAR